MYILRNANILKKHQMKNDLLHQVVTCKWYFQLLNIFFERKKKGGREGRTDNKIIES